MHNDEEATHARFTALLSGAIEPVIAEHGGRIVKNTGDGFLAEFPSAVEAVRAALQFRTRIKELTISEAEDSRISFQVGVNIGDVIVLPSRPVGARTRYPFFHDSPPTASRMTSTPRPLVISLVRVSKSSVR